MSTTVNFRESSLKQSFKAAVEAAQPTFVNPVDNEVYALQIGLVPNPETHFSSSTDIIPCTFKAIASAFSAPFFKCKADSAIVFNKDNGEFVAAGIVRYDADGESYKYSVSFDPNDINNIDKSHVVNYGDFIDENRNMNFFEIFISEMLNSHNYGISDKGVISLFIMATFDVIFHWLDVNAKADEVVELDITDYIGVYEILTEQEYNERLKTVAIASVEVVKDIKKMSVTFGEEMEEIAKGGSDLHS